MAEVSVVVPSIGRRDGVAAIAERVALDPCRPELIVVDNSPTGDGIGTIDGARVVREHRPGAAHARNRGASEATGRVLVFLDDDVTIGDDTVSTLAAPVLAGDAASTVGRVRLDPQAVLPPWLRPPLLGYLSNHDRGERAHDLPRDDHGLSAALAVDRAVFEAVGGFWEGLGPRPGQQRTNDDVQLCRAIMRTGATIRYLPQATVVHAVPPSRRTRRYVLARAFEQGRSDWLLERRWEGTPATTVLTDALVAFGRDLAGNARRIGSGPGTAMRVAAALARLAGTAGCLVREPAS